MFLGRAVSGQLVAVKSVRPDLAGNPEFRARFRQEAAAARQVESPYTVLVADADVSGVVPWLATAYICGPSLADAVLGHGPLPVPAVRTLAAGLAAGLQATHAAGVVHRDLKPSNVLLAADGPRLIDFGVSRAAEGSSLTQSGLVLGSPGFLSPGQAEGHPVGPASDVFSLGAVIAFAATGEGPFGTGVSAALLYRVVYSPPFLGRLPAELRPLAERCLAKDPAGRPTVGELVAQLGSPVPAPGWLPEPIASSLHQYLPSGHHPPADLVLAAAPDLVLRAAAPAAAAPAPGRGDSAAPAAKVAVGEVLAAVPERAGRQRSRRQRSRRRRLDLAWLAATSGLAAAAVAVIVLPGAAQRSLVLLPELGSGLQPGSFRPDVTTPIAQRALPAGTARTTPPPSGTAVASQVAGTASAVAIPASPSGSPITARAPHPPRPPEPPVPPVPPVPDGVTAAASGSYTIRVSWSEPLRKVTGFRIDNGCPAGACGGGGASLHRGTGRVTSTVFTVTPGTSQCFRVQAISGSRASDWSRYACTSTPGLVLTGGQGWLDTGVTLHADDLVGIAAGGQLTVPGGATQTPAGDAACSPATADPPGTSYPAPDLPCWSLVGRIGAGPVFEAGDAALLTAAAGRLYLAVNEPAGSADSGSWTVNIKLGGMPVPP